MKVILLMYIFVDEGDTIYSMNLSTFKDLQKEKEKTIHSGFF